MPKVSIIVPVYNTSKYLRRCMDALVSQTLGDIEIIAVNDGSTDDSMNILCEYKDRYPDKVKIFTKENGGIEYADKRMWDFHAEAMNFLDTYVEDKDIYNALKAYLDFVIERKA